MSRDSSKAGLKPTTRTRAGRPTHAIALAGRFEDYALSPCDVAFEKEYGGVQPAPLLKKGGGAADNIVTEIPGNGASKPDLWGRVPHNELSIAERLTLVSHWAAEADPGFRSGLVDLVATFEKATTPNAAPTLRDITPAQMEVYRLVAAAISREHRANLTPEQAAYDSEQGAKRVAASRARQTPEQRAARSEREAARLRYKRALAKAPQP